jgi:hypothetical protein
VAIAAFPGWSLMLIPSIPFAESARRDRPYVIDSATPFDTELTSVGRIVIFGECCCSCACDSG